MSSRGQVISWALTLLLLVPSARAQFGGGFRGGGFGGGSGGGSQRTSLLPRFDQNKDGHLDATERAAAREYISGRSRRSGAVRSDSSTAKEIAPSDVKTYGDESLYDPKVFRTLFLDFEESDWEQELADFYHTDVEVPARLTVDGKVYPDVGVTFRGSTSYSMVPMGLKHSLGVSVDYLHDDQRLLGFRSLNLLNSNLDPTFMRTYLYQYVSRQYIAAPDVNFVRVVINGEDWGVYVNTEQIGTDMIKEQFGTRKGNRWKVSGQPHNVAGLTYLGDSVSSYKSRYEIKSDDDPEAWTDLINLCRVLNRTPSDQLEAALDPIMDVDEVLKFLALDKALQNNDGYWTKAGDYGLYEDKDGRFHVIPWDANETFSEASSGRGRSSGAADLDPFTGADDPAKALLYNMLRVPALRTKYLGYIRDIAENWMTWDKLGPVVEEAQALIGDEVAADRRKIYSTASFRGGATQDYFQASSFGRMSPPTYSLKGFLRDRREYLLSYPGIAPGK